MSSPRPHTLIMCLSTDLRKCLGWASLWQWKYRDQNIHRASYHDNLNKKWLSFYAEVAYYACVQLKWCLWILYESVAGESEDGNHHSWQALSMRLNASRLLERLWVYPWSQHSPLVWLSLACFVVYGSLFASKCDFKVATKNREYKNAMNLGF